MAILQADVLERLSRIVRQERGALVAVARTEGLNAEEAVECVQDALATPLPAIDPNAEALLSHAEDVVRLRACVAELCSIQRAVITLRLLEERSGEDVAVQLGITRKHVDVLVHRAKASLRVCMRHTPPRGHEAT